LLRRILTQSKGSAVAKALGISGDESFAEFLELAPRSYSFYVPFVEQTLDGDHLAFGREPIVALGETSGSLGNPKLIPHSAASLECVRQFAKRLLLFQLLDGDHYIPMYTKWLAVTASTNVRIDRGIPVGFISGLMYQIAQKKRRGFLLPTPAIAAISDWDERIQESVAEAWDKRVGTMLGVPAYLMRFLEAASVRANGKPLGEVWPLLGRVYYSGTSIAPYREQMERTLGRRLRVQGLYTATEGSFGAELDPMSPGELHLMVDLAVFAFRDLEEPGSGLVSAWEVTRGHRYEVLVTTPAGLIQYQIGDVLEVTETCPLRIRVVGRTEEEINIATEKLSLKQAYATLERALRTDVHRDHFMVVPDPMNPRRHLWIVEASEPGSDVEAAVLIDGALASINPSYAALRQGDAVLDRPRVVVCEPGSFDAYIAAGFAMRGQFKFRHLFPDAEALKRTIGLEAFARQLGAT
ncbi:MAG: GH3 auxin-responsive promoter family protein, partial [Gemmatimonadota bacterium]|nr:GH3 auxin-responsive promoter family protein [Gemmatimonadota bacterium]